MAKGIGIVFHADASEVVDESKKVQRALGGVDDELDKVGTTAEASERKQTDALDSVSNSAKDLGTTVATDTAAGFEELGTKSGGVLDDLTGSLLGAAGIAGGVGGLVTTGLGAAIQGVTGFIEDQQAAAAELKTNLTDAYKAAAEEGRNYLVQAQIVSSSMDTLFGTKRAAAQAEADRIGVDLITYAMAQAGSVKDLKVVIEAATEAQDALIASQNRAGGGQAGVNAGLVAQSEAIGEIIAKNEDLLQVHKDGAQAAADTQVVRDRVAEQERAQIQRTRDADQGRYEALAAQHAAAGQLAPVTLRTDIQVPDVDTIFDGLQRKLSGKTLTVKAGVETRYGERVL